MKRLFDLFLSIILMVLMLLPMAIIAILVKLSSEGDVLYWSDRVGKNNKIFQMPKFRTMTIGALDARSVRCQPFPHG